MAKVHIATAGMWHLGSVTAAGLSSVGHQVTGIDEKTDVIEGLKKAIMPVREPGLAELTEAGLSNGTLRFSSHFKEAATADVIWITYDTPVNDADVADVEFVHERVLRLLAHVKNGAVIIVSSQMPVGSIARLEAASRQAGRDVSFACVPENLRLGNAVEIFLKPDRVVAGIRDDRARTAIETIYKPLGARLEWMSVESAEVTKHAINSFLAASICFINEIAGLCEHTGADAIEVERGLKTDQRIGQLAYLHPGGAFGGGTLARDLALLQFVGMRKDLNLPLIDGVVASNQQHKAWLQRKITASLQPLAGKIIGLLGLTYKPGTNTLRGSNAIGLARWLAGQEARVRAFDPQIDRLPEDLLSTLTLVTSLEDLDGTDALVLMTPLPEFLGIDPSKAPRMVFDPPRFLETLFRDATGVRYHAIGRPDDAS